MKIKWNMAPEWKDSFSGSEMELPQNTQISAIEKENFDEVEIIPPFLNIAGLKCNVLVWYMSNFIKKVNHDRDGIVRPLKKHIGIILWSCHLGLLHVHKT